RRRDLIKRLESGSKRSKRSAGQGPAALRLDRPAHDASKKLPSGTDLYQDELRIRFTSAADLAAKLSVVSEAIRADSDVFAAHLRTAPPPPAPVQQNKPAEQLETREPETSLRLKYY